MATVTTCTPCSANPVLMIAASPGSSSTKRTRIGANLQRWDSRARSVIRMTATRSKIHLPTTG